MSTGKDNTMAQKIAKLARSKETIFHAGDLANLWGITNENTLHVTLSRAVRQNLLTRLRKGLYTIMTPSELDDHLIGAKMLHGFCYISTETILAREGYISHTVPYATFVSDLSHKWKFVSHHYLSRQLTPRYLYHPEGINLHGQVYEATIERAIADMLYFNPFYHFDRPIDVKKVRAMQEKIGYPTGKFHHHTRK